MAAPDFSTVLFYKGDQGSPSNDVDLVGGSIDLTEEIVQDDFDKIINTPTFDNTDQTYYGVFHIKNTASGSLTQARFVNRNALRFMGTDGNLVLTFTGGQDAGKKWFIWGKVGGTYMSEYVTCPNAAGQAYTIRSYDANTPMFMEFVNSSNQADLPISSMYVSLSGTTIGVAKGTSVNPGYNNVAVRQLYTFANYALRSSLNSSLTYPNRKTNTADGISSYAFAYRWDGNDYAIPVPGGTLASNDSIAIGCRLQLPGDFITTAFGRLSFVLTIIGNAIP